MYPPEYQHILDFLDSNPEYLQDMRTRLLMPDLVALPEQFAQMVGLVTDLSASFQAFAEATDRRLTSLVLQSHLNRECLKASLVMGLQGSGLMPASPP